MNDIWFFKKDLLVGGTELLIDRIACNLINKGFNVSVIYQSAMDDIIQRFQNHGINYYSVKNWYNTKDISQYIKLSNVTHLCIVFSIEDFCTVYQIKNADIKTLLYTVYYDQLIIGNSTYSKIGKHLTKNLVSNLLTQMLKSKNFACMDEHTIQNTIQYYGKLLKLGKENFPILRIPVDIIPEKSIKRAPKIKDSISILSIARADFPWKGYLIGLIGLLERNQLLSNAKLTIVSYGKGETIIKDRIAKCDKNVRSRITLIGKTNYEDLESLYGNTDLYIGQGTTVLDAAQRYVITIPVVPDTYDVISDKYFHEDFTRVTVRPGVLNNIDRMIETVYKMDHVQYINTANIGRNLVVENYGTEHIATEILNVFNVISENKYSFWVESFQASKHIKAFINKISSSLKK